MDTLSVIALSVVALVIVAVIIAYRHKLAVVLEFLGVGLKIQAENKPPDNPAEPPPVATPTGVDIEGATSSAGGLYVGSGSTVNPTGVGVRLKDVEVKDDIIVDSGQSGSQIDDDPKADPPA